MGTYINRCCERSHATAASLQIRPRCARLLAKPQYSSPPDEVCCWPGCRGGSPGERHSLGGAAAGKGTAGTEDCWPGRCGGAAAGREPSAQRTACWGAVAEQGHSRGRAPGEMHSRGGSPGERQSYGRAPGKRRRLGGAVAGREPSAQRTACWDADEAAARQGRWHRARAPLRGSGAGRKQELARGVRS